MEIKEFFLYELECFSKQVIIVKTINQLTLIILNRMTIQIKQMRNMDSYSMKPR